MKQITYFFPQNNIEIKWSLSFVTNSRILKWIYFVFYTGYLCGESLYQTNNPYLEKIHRKQPNLTINFTFCENYEIIKKYSHFFHNASSYIFWGLTSVYSRHSRDYFSIIFNRQIFKNAFNKKDEKLLMDVRSLIAHELAHCFDMYLHGIYKPKHGYDWYQLAKLMGATDIQKYANRIRLLKSNPYK